MQQNSFMKLLENEKIDYNYMTAPCGLPCFECYLYLAEFDQGMAETIASLFNVSPDEIKCKGCRGENGKCAHHSMECRVYKCIENTDMKTCAECKNFPCEYLHPYRDQAEKWHNTKVYNLCRIKKSDSKNGQKRRLAVFWTNISMVIGLYN